MYIASILGSGTMRMRRDKQCSSIETACVEIRLQHRFIILNKLKTHIADSKTILIVPGTIIALLNTFSDKSQ